MANNRPDHSASSASRYRAYLIGQDGRVSDAVEIDALDDEAAIAQAKDLTRTYEVELWDRSRVVVRLPTLTCR